MSTVALGLGVQRTLPTERRVLKGISGNRERYDRRRRLNTDSAETVAYKAILGCDPCGFCGARPEPGRVSDRDHIVPLLQGGIDDWENMTAACRRCNRGRRERSLLTTLLRRL